MNKVINKSLIEHSYDYTSYRKMIDDLFEQNKTTGENHSESMLHYAKMNIQRMKRWDKTLKLLPEVVETISKVKDKQIWLTITEGWCGDAAQIVPIVDHLAKLNANIEHRLILRDEHLDVIDQFLTSGSRSIPVTVLMDAETLDVLGSWGPRPGELQEWYMDKKKKDDFVWKEASAHMHKWYAKDRGVQTQLEFTESLKKAIASIELVF